MWEFGVTPGGVSILGQVWEDFLYWLYIYIYFSWLIPGGCIFYFFVVQQEYSLRDQNEASELEVLPFWVRELFLLAK